MRSTGPLLVLAVTETPQRVSATTRQKADSSRFPGGHYGRGKEGPRYDSLFSRTRTETMEIRRLRVNIYAIRGPTSTNLSR